MKIANVSKRRRSLLDTLEILPRISDAMQCDGFHKPEEGELADAILRKDVVTYDKYNQAVCLFKKLPPATNQKDTFEKGSTTEELRYAAFTKFYETLDRVNQVDLSHFSRNDRFVPHHNRGGKIIQRARCFISNVVGEVTLQELFLGCKHGKGMVLGSDFGKTSESSKWTAPLTGTSDAIRLFSLYLNWDRSFFRSLLLAQGLEIGLIQLLCSDPLCVEEQISIFCNNFVTEVRGSRATTVPKNNKTDRMIALEPCLNMFFQQGLMVWLYGKLVDFGVDLESQQEKNAFLAYLGSKYPDLLGTLDLESASDSVLLSLCSLLFTSSVYSLLCMVRSPEIEVNEVFVGLDILATMGNATTFPVETLVFLSLMVAVISYEKDTSNSAFVDLAIAKDLGIFGDDCILPTQYVPNFINTLTDLGFRVNEEKSCVDPTIFFRESCGRDFLNGHDVRAVYISSRPPTRGSDLESWLYKYHNSLLRKCISHFGESWLEKSSNLVATFHSLFQKYNIHPCVVPLDYPIDSGIYCFSEAYGSLPSLLATRPKFPSFSPQKGGYVFEFKRFVYRDVNIILDDFVWRSEMVTKGHKEILVKSYSDFDLVEVCPSKIPFYLEVKKLPTLHELALFLRDNLKDRDSSITLKRGKVINSYANKTVYERQIEEDQGHSWETHKRVGGYVVAKGISFSFLREKANIDKC